MVTFLPFKGYRPRLQAGETTADRVSPPYDSINDEELKEYQSHPGNVTNLTLSPDVDRRYTKARKLLDEMIQYNGIMQDPESFYVYDQTFTFGGSEYHRRGIVGILKIEDGQESNVVRHVDINSKVRNDRLNLLKDLETDVESVFGIVQELGTELNRKIENTCRLCCRYVDKNGVEHRYSRVSDEAVCKEISAKLEGQKMILADGHQRYDAAAAYAKENPGCDAKQYILCTIVPADDPGLLIQPAYRLIDAEDIGETSAIKKIGKKMVITEVAPEEFDSKLGDHLFGMMFRSGKCILLDNLGEENEMLKLDTYSAQTNILNGVYKSDEGKSKISYTSEIADAKQQMADKKHDAAVIFKTPDTKSLLDMLSDGRKLPKKTACFYPKIWSGWVFYKMV